MFKAIILLILGINAFGAYGLTDEQIGKVQDTYTIGKTIKAKDGTTFENTLCGMLGQESSFGELIVGDKYDRDGKLKSLYESSLGAFQIKLKTAKLVIKEYPHLYKKYSHLLNGEKDTYMKYKKHKEKVEYYQSVLMNEKWLLRKIKGEPKAIATMEWAKREHDYHMTFVKKYGDVARRDTRLINKLLTNHKFGAEIAGHYLLKHYNYVKAKGWSNSYKRAVGRYNGGWNNIAYANKVLKRMKLVTKLVNKGIIK